MSFPIDKQNKEATKATNSQRKENPNLSNLVINEKNLEDNQPYQQQDEKSFSENEESKQDILKKQQDDSCCKQDNKSNRVDNAVEIDSSEQNFQFNKSLDKSDHKSNDPSSKDEEQSFSFSQEDSLERKNDERKHKEGSEDQANNKVNISIKTQQQFNKKNNSIAQEPLEEQKQLDQNLNNSNQNKNLKKQNLKKAQSFPSNPSQTSSLSSSLNQKSFQYSSTQHSLQPPSQPCTSTSTASAQSKKSYQQKKMKLMKQKYEQVQQKLAMPQGQVQQQQSSELSISDSKQSIKSQQIQHFELSDSKQSIKSQQIQQFELSHSKYSIKNQQIQQFELSNSKYSIKSQQIQQFELSDSKNDCQSFSQQHSQHKIQPKHIEKKQQKLKQKQKSELERELKQEQSQEQKQKQKLKQQKSFASPLPQSSSFQYRQESQESQHLSNSSSSSTQSVVASKEKSTPALGSKSISSAPFKKKKQHSYEANSFLVPSDEKQKKKPFEQKNKNKSLCQGLNPISASQSKKQQKSQEVQLKKEERKSKDQDEFQEDQNSKSQDKKIKPHTTTNKSQKTDNSFEAMRSKIFQSEISLITIKQNPSGFINKSTQSSQQATDEDKISPQQKQQVSNIVKRLNLSKTPEEQTIVYKMKSIKLLINQNPQIEKNLDTCTYSFNSLNITQTIDQHYIKKLEKWDRYLFTDIYLHQDLQSSQIGRILSVDWPNIKSIVFDIGYNKKKGRFQLQQNDNFKYLRNHGFHRKLTQLQFRCYKPFPEIFTLIADTLSFDKLEELVMQFGQPIQKKDITELLSRKLSSLNKNCKIYIPLNQRKNVNSVGFEGYQSRIQFPIFDWIQEQDSFQANKKKQIGENGIEQIMKILQKQSQNQKKIKGSLNF